VGQEGIEVANGPAEDGAARGECELSSNEPPKGRGQRMACEVSLDGVEDLLGHPKNCQWKHGDGEAASQAAGHHGGAGLPDDPDQLGNVLEGLQAGPPALPKCLGTLSHTNGVFGDSADLAD